MGIKDFFVNKDNKADYADIDNKEKLEGLVEEGLLKPVHILPISMGGNDIPENITYLPEATVELKKKYEMLLEDLIADGKMDRYDINLKYKGNSLVPAAVVFKAIKDEEIVQTETVDIW